MINTSFSLALVASSAMKNGSYPQTIRVSNSHPLMLDMFRTIVLFSESSLAHLEQTAASISDDPGTMTMPTLFDLFEASVLKYFSSLLKTLYSGTCSSLRMSMGSGPEGNLWTLSILSFVLFSALKSSLPWAFLVLDCKLWHKKS